MMYAILESEARAANLPADWAEVIALDTRLISADAMRAAVADAREWLGITDIAAKRSALEAYDVRAIALDYRRAGLPLARFRADIVSRLAAADEHIDTSRPLYPADRLSSTNAQAAMNEISRQFWTAHKAEQEGDHAAA